MAVEPDYIVTTGDYLAEWLEEEGMNQSELARRAGVSKKHISELVAGNSALSQAVALNLEMATGIPARIWMAYETRYQQLCARKRKEQELAAEIDMLDAYPLAYMRKHGIVTTTKRQASALVGQVAAFFRTSSLRAHRNTWEAEALAFRKSAHADKKPMGLAVWLRVGEIQHEQAGPLPPFDRECLMEILPRIRSYTLEAPEEGIKKAIMDCERVGVRVCLTPAVSGVGVHGVTRWVNGTPLVQLSLLWKTEDQMWFTLMHELAHVLLHKTTTVYLEGSNDKCEAEANRFAAEFFVPKEMRGHLPSGRNTAAIAELAEQLEVSPSIVLGQAQRVTKDYAWGSGLKRQLPEIAPIPPIPGLA
ncbi:ImmA/IrrE family metallo-endopeptidase [Schaalia sp. Marseille-Q2122]|uniref:ImmA/IrrE family metallo-endopeptidase n=1 Tax=Schaalia sp. Marseille-Q2122 TaxID=2736604 RepID=UPI001588B195|nr:ImmA/IrrE family metallo-endopeptidase [Schaalia sp. Marseille-Q2122]